MEVVDIASAVRRRLKADLEGVPKETGRRETNMPGNGRSEGFKVMSRIALDGSG
jgi:hypothetical protein